MENRSLLSFHGSGSKYFGIQIVNILLMVLTLGFYYPWAKADRLKYLYSEVEFKGSRFSFTGTGKEIFKGFLKMLVIVVVMYGSIFLFTYLALPMIGLLIVYLIIFAVTPLAIHGSLKYRLSRTSWRGIHFGYRGSLKELNILFYKNLFFTIITFGIYGAWMAVNLRNYTISNVRFGNIKVNSNGSGSEYLLTNFVGYLLAILTLGIYSFWWINKLFQFYIDNICLYQGDKIVKLRATTTGLGFMKVYLVNFLIVIITLGFGSPWAEIRLYKYILKNIQFQDDIDENGIIQTEADYRDATGEDISDFFDFNVI